jgi:hypothetical protein
MQQLKTITTTTKNTVDSVHVDTLYAVLQNVFNAVVLSGPVEPDCTGASYYCIQANCFAQLQDLYVSVADDTDYVALSSIMQIFANNIVYYDQSSIYDSAVANTVLQTVNLNNYACLSN